MNTFDNNRIEKTIAELFGYDNAVITGNGTTAIYLIIKALGIKKRKIVIPAISCSYPLFSVLLSDNEPVLCDININSGCIDANSLLHTISRIDNIGAVIGIHLYGNIMDDYWHICEYCTSNDIILIDDFAQAIGIPFYGLGKEKNDISVLSFGRDKIIDAGHGGVILTDNRYVALELKNIQKGLNSFDTSTPYKQKRFRDYFYSIFDNADFSAIKKQKILCNSVLENKNIFIYNHDMKYNQVLLDSLDNIDNEFNKRRENLFLYKNIFQNHSTFHDIINDETVPWKYSIRIEGSNYSSNLAIIKRLRAKGIAVSNHYPSLDNIYVNEQETELKSAKVFEQEIFNFPVQSAVKEYEISSITNSFFREIGELN
jgi:dTDP-4-amino-4,6-dideoxygalactose transaminase